VAVLVISVIAFVFGFVGSMPLAGPIAVLVVSNSFEGRHSAALRLAFGAATAEAIYAFVAFFTFTTLLARYPIVVPISHAVTAVVLLVVGIYFMRWRERSAEEAQKKKDQSAKESKSASFFLGFSVSALNPTLLVTWSAATAVLYSKGVAHLTNVMAIAFGLAAGLGVAAWQVILVALIRRYQSHFPRRALTWIVRGMGLLLVGIAVWSAIDLVRYVQGIPRI
jgi:threonine/homoserine/homoserine lactone efflux protein